MKCSYEKSAYSVTTAEDLLVLLHDWQALSLSQIVRILNRESSINNIRAKIKRLVDEGLVDYQFLPRAQAGGKSPLIYSASRKGKALITGTGGSSSVHRQPDSIEGILPLYHLLECNEVLLASLLLARRYPAIVIEELRHEHMFKKQPLRLSDTHHLCPDGFTRLALHPPFTRKEKASMGICWEVDRGSEDAAFLTNKIASYQALYYGRFEVMLGVENLCTAFVVTKGGKPRSAQLVHILAQALEQTPEDAELYVCTHTPPTHIDPAAFFLDDIWYMPYCLSSLPLIRQFENERRH